MATDTSDEKDTTATNETKDAAQEAPVKAGAVTKKDIEKNKVWALVSYLTIIGLIIAMVSEGKDSPFVKFHINQSLPLVIAVFGNFVFAMIPIIGWLLAPLIGIGLLILIIMGILNAANGQMKRLPIVGNFELIK